MYRHVTPTVKEICRRFKHWDSAQYQYLQQSKLPTLHFQKSLPRLPIPKLEESCNRYLAAQTPLLKDEQFVKTRENVLNFKDSVGQVLQELLKSKDKKNKQTSYIADLWFDMYLRDRQPLPINYNPVMIFYNNDKPEYNNQLIKTTNLLISSLRFYKSLKDNVLEPEVFHLNARKSDTNRFRSICAKVPSAFSWYAAYLHNAYPLDMTQYPMLFNTTRIPEIGKDRIYHEDGAKHVLVQHKGNFFVCDVFDDLGNILPPNKILGKLQFILKSNLPPLEYPIGVLTTQNRDKWASVRNHFTSISNANALKLIDSALFNICLDEEEVGTDPYTLSKHFLHGNGKNRWFDKSFSLLVSKDGVAGVNFEHSWGDGVAVLRYFQDIHKDSLENPQVHPDTIPDSEDATTVHKLEFKFDDQIKSAVDSAIKEYKATTDSLDVQTLEFPGVGKNLCKKHSLSPDAIMQLAFQAAYYKQAGNFVPTYESCSTAAFKHGRTEAIRPCTIATMNYCKAVASTQPAPKSELKHLITECSKMHGKLTREAAMGQGFDRYFFALRKLAENNEKLDHQLFRDPAFLELNHNIISTSTLNSPAVWVGAFGPVCKDGYGIAYSIIDDMVRILVTSYPPHRNGKDFINCLKASFEEMSNILENS